MWLAFPSDLDLAQAAVTVREAEPLPEDRGAWRRRVAGADGPVAEAATPSGWPLITMHVGSTTFGFYELYDRGLVAEIAGDAERALAILRAGDLDRTPREVVSVAQLWDAG